MLCNIVVPFSVVFRMSPLLGSPSPSLTPHPLDVQESLRVLAQVLERVTLVLVLDPNSARPRNLGGN